MVSAMPKGPFITDVDQVHVHYDQKLGDGGFSDVYKATITHPDGSTTTGAAKKHHRFDPNEIKIMKELNHKNIIKYLGAIETEEKVDTIIFMELAEKDLFHFLHVCKGKNRNRNLPKDVQFKWVMQAALALQYLHKKGLLHRDIKSPNYLIMANNFLKLGDFGRSKHLDPTKITSVSSGRGSARWMPPEVIATRVRYLKSDCHSYGIVVWEILTGLIPFHEMACDVDVMVAIRDGKRPQIPAHCHEKFQRILVGCWKADINERLSMDDVIKIICECPADSDSSSHNSVEDCVIDTPTLPTSEELPNHGNHGPADSDSSSCSSVEDCVIDTPTLPTSEELPNHGPANSDSSSHSSVEDHVIDTPTLPTSEELPNHGNHGPADSDSSSRSSVGDRVIDTPTLPTSEELPNHGPANSDSSSHSSVEDHVIDTTTLPTSEELPNHGNHGPANSDSSSHSSVEDHVIDTTTLPTSEELPNHGNHGPANSDSSSHSNVEDRVIDTPTMLTSELPNHDLDINSGSSINQYNSCGDDVVNKLSTGAELSDHVPDTSHQGSEERNMRPSSLGDSSTEERTYTELPAEGQLEPLLMRRPKMTDCQMLLYFVIGIDSIWRFPDMFCLHGGFAFVIAYIILMAVIVPPLFAIETGLGQISGLGLSSICHMSPICTGAVYAMIFITFIMSIYYNMLFVYVFRYWVESFHGTGSLLPSRCKSSLNTTWCFGYGDNNFVVGAHIVTKYGVIIAGNGEVGNFAPVRWYYWLGFVALLLLIPAIYHVHERYKYFNKVSYLMYPLAVLLTCFLAVFAVCKFNIKYLFYADFSKLKNYLLWKDAAVHVLYNFGCGLGILHNLGSFHNFGKLKMKLNCVMIASLILSIMWAVIVKSTLGYMADTLKIHIISEVTHSGLGLIFTTCPLLFSLLGTFGNALLWVFFVLLMYLILQKQLLLFGNILNFIRAMVSWAGSKCVFNTMFIILSVLLGLPLTTRDGRYLIHLLDNKLSLSLIGVVIMEFAALHGFKRFIRNTSAILTTAVLKSFKAWGFFSIFSPLLILSIFWFNYTTFMIFELMIWPAYNLHVYSASVKGVLLTIWLAPTAVFILCACFRIRHAKTPTISFVQAFKISMQPTRLWLTIVLERYSDEQSSPPPLPTKTETTV